MEQTAQQRPGASRWTTFALALGGFAIGTTEFASMGLLSYISENYRITEPVAGHLISAYALGVVVGAPVIAVLCARIPSKKLLVALMGAFTLGNALSVVAPTYEMLLVARFLSGLPHGAYFGVAMVVAAHLAPQGKQAAAVGKVIMGLAVANVLGVPAVTFLGQYVGWRSAYLVVVVLGIATVVAVVKFLPPLTELAPSHPIAELRTLKRARVWFALLIGAVGFGGEFAFYTYIDVTLRNYSDFPAKLMPLALMVFGAGMVIGNIVGGRWADRALVPSIVAGIGLITVTLLLFVAFGRVEWLALPLTFSISFAGSAAFPGLQMQLMNAAGDAPNLAASLNHSSLNIANAAGAFFGGMAINAGWGYGGPAIVGALLAVCGLLILGISVWFTRKSIIS